MVSIFDILGLTGVAISITCYAAVQWRRDFAKDILYSIGNGVSAACMLVSLWHNWNLSAFAGNISWGVLSIYGIYRCLKYSKQQAKLNDAPAVLPQQTDIFP